MWLLPIFSGVSSIAARVYYRLTIDGGPIEETGPVLLVANHPNSLLDPMLVAAAAKRPVRFLAKAPLFQDKKIGWLIRASGAIPVFRRVDNPDEMGKNVEMFRAVVEALNAGSAVGIFPEGISHSDPAITELKTGAARIALSTARAGTQITIAPVGIILRDKDLFRSEASIVIGTPVKWSDLSSKGPEDREAVQDLTTRIGERLRDVTLNLEAWADKPVVQCAEAIWATEYGGGDDMRSRVARLRVTTEVLARLRREENDRATEVVDAVKTHYGRLRKLRLKPGDIKSKNGPPQNVLWAVRRFHLFGLVAIVVGVIGWALFWTPYQITGKLAGSPKIPPDRRSTYKLLIGMAVYGIWLATVSIVAGVLATPVTGVVTAVVLPLLGMVGLRIRERWRETWRDIKRYSTRRARSELMGALADRQKRIAGQLKELYEKTT